MRYYAMTWRFLNNVRNIRKDHCTSHKILQARSKRIKYELLLLKSMHFALSALCMYTLLTYNIFTNFSKNVVPQSKSENVFEKFSPFSEK